MIVRKLESISSAAVLVTNKSRVSCHVFELAVLHSQAT